MRLVLVLFWGVGFIPPILVFLFISAIKPFIRIFELSTIGIIISDLETVFGGMNPTPLVIPNALKL